MMLAVNTSRHMAIAANIRTETTTTGRPYVTADIVRVEPGAAAKLHCKSNGDKVTVLGAQYLGNPDVDVDAFDNASITDEGDCKVQVGPKGGSPGRTGVVHNADRTKAIVVTLKQEVQPFDPGQAPFDFYESLVVPPGGSGTVGFGCYPDKEFPEIVGARYY